MCTWLVPQHHWFLLSLQRQLSPDCLNTKHSLTPLFPQRVKDKKRERNKLKHAVIHWAVACSNIEKEHATFRLMWFGACWSYFAWMEYQVSKQITFLALVVMIHTRQHTNIPWKLGSYRQSVPPFAINIKWIGIFPALFFFQICTKHTYSIYVNSCHVFNINIY